MTPGDGGRRRGQGGRGRDRDCVWGVEESTCNRCLRSRQRYGEGRVRGTAGFLEERRVDP